jgi:hypothetical protein
VPGWPSWLGRQTHRVSKVGAFLGHLEAAGSNPAPGIFLLVKISPFIVNIITSRHNKDFFGEA